MNHWYKTIESIEKHQYEMIENLKHFQSLSVFKSDEKLMNLVQNKIKELEAYKNKPEKFVKPSVNCKETDYSSEDISKDFVVDFYIDPSSFTFLSNDSDHRSNIKNEIESISNKIMKEFEKFKTNNSNVGENVSNNNLVTEINEDNIDNFIESLSKDDYDLFRKRRLEFLVDDFHHFCSMKYNINCCKITVDNVEDTINIFNYEVQELFFNDFLTREITILKEILDKNKTTV